MAGHGKFIVAVAVALSLGAAVKPAHAQLAVSDAVTESMTTDMDQNQFPALRQQDSAIATSVTTGGGAGNYTPIGGYIANLNQQLFSGINNQNFAGNFPGWVPLPNNSTLTAEALVKTTLTTYQASIALAQSQEQELEGENFTAIEQAAANTTNVLTALQALTDATLQVAQEIQYERQLMATLITVESTQAAQRLSAKAQEVATSETSPIPIVGP